MNRSMLITLGALIACLVVPTMAGASIAFTKIVAPYTFTSQPVNSTIYIYNHFKAMICISLVNP